MKEATKKMALHELLLKRKISQSDCEIRSNCGKKKLLKGDVTQDNLESPFSMQQGSVKNYVCYKSRFSKY